jgi:hypothetical protein
MSSGERSIAKTPFPQGKLFAQHDNRSHVEQNCQLVHFGKKTISGHQMENTKRTREPNGLSIISAWEK